MRKILALACVLAFGCDSASGGKHADGGVVHDLGHSPSADLAPKPVRPDGFTPKDASMNTIPDLGTCAGCWQVDENGVSSCAPSGNTNDSCGKPNGICAACGAGSLCQDGACVPVCNAQTCTGCCDTDGNCQVDQDSACGSGGTTSCVACVNGSTCKDGECVTTTNTQTCAQTCATGCCTAAGECKSGDQDGACGDGGDVCQACRTGFFCAYQTCNLDFSSLWDVVVLNGTVPDFDLNGYAWDPWPSPLPDPYVCVQLFDDAFTRSCSNSDANTYTPNWLQVLVSGMSAGDLLNGIGFDVWDKDTAFDDLIGACGFATDPAAFTSTQTVTCPRDDIGAGYTLRYRFLPHR